MCKHTIKRALRDDQNGKLICFNCVTNYTPVTADSDEEEMQAALSAAIRSGSYEKVCKCGNKFTSQDARTTMCPTCRSKLTTCEVTGCGAMFVPTYPGDKRCPEHSPRCVSCGKKTGNTFCKTCHTAIERGVCTNCGEEVIDNVVDHRGRCMECMDSDMDFFMGEAYCRCGINIVDDPAIVCPDCPTYTKICPYCWDARIKSDELMCRSCLNTKDDT